MESAQTNRRRPPGILEIILFTPESVWPPRAAPAHIRQNSKRPLKVIWRGPALSFEENTPTVLVNAPTEAVDMFPPGAVNVGWLKIFEAAAVIVYVSFSESLNLLAMLK